MATEILQVGERARMMGIAAGGRDSKKIMRRLAPHPGEPAAHAPPPPEFARCTEAFEAEFDYLYRTVLRHGVPRQDAEDVVQDVFLVMWRRWDEYDPTRPLRPWLAGIASRAAQGRRRRHAPALDTALASDDGLDPEQRLDASRARALVRAALGALPDRYRTLVILRDLDQLTVSEIASLQNVSVATASARVRSARQAFARAVNRLVKTGALGKLLVVPPVESLLAIERACPPPGARSGGRRLGWTHPLVVSGGALVTAAALVITFALARRPASKASVLPSAASAAGGVLAASAARDSRSGAPGLATAPVPTSESSARSVRAALGSGAGSVAGSPGLDLLEPPTARYPFDERPGATAARDLSGGENDCRLHGLDPRSAWIAGRHGQAVHLGGAGWLDCPRVDRLTALTDEITVAAWIRPTRSRWGMQTIVARQEGHGRADDIFFGLQNDRLMVRSRTFRKQVDRPLPTAHGPWIHVAVTRAARGTVTLYADGTPLGTNRGRPMPIGGGRAPLTIGGRLTTTDPTHAEDLFAGDLDDLIILPRALPASEIAALAR